MCLKECRIPCQMKSIRILFLIVLPFFACNNYHGKKTVNNIDSSGKSKTDSVKPDKSSAINKEIYSFIRMAVKKIPLNLKYNLRPEPLKNCNNESDSIFLNSLLDDSQDEKSAHKKSSSLQILKLYGLPKCLTAEDIKLMLGQRLQSQKFSWDGKYLGFSLESDNWYSFSVPLFSKDRKKVIFGVEELRSSYSRSKKIYLLHKEGDDWKSSVGYQEYF